MEVNEKTTRPRTYSPGRDCTADDEIDSRIKLRRRGSSLKDKNDVLDRDTMGWIIAPTGLNQVPDLV